MSRGPPCRSRLWIWPVRSNPGKFYDIFTVVLRNFCSTKTVSKIVSNMAVTIKWQLVINLTKVSTNKNVILVNMLKKIMVTLMGTLTVLINQPTTWKWTVRHGRQADVIPELLYTIWYVILSNFDSRFFERTFLRQIVLRQSFLTTIFFYAKNIFMPKSFFYAKKLFYDKKIFRSKNFVPKKIFFFWKL